MSEPKEFTLDERWTAIIHEDGPCIVIDDGTVIACVHSDGKGGLERANVMAAAPAMREALEELMDAIRGYFGWDGNSEIDQEDGLEYFIGEYRKAERAIAKAEGLENE